MEVYIILYVLLLLFAIVAIVIKKENIITKLLLIMLLILIGVIAGTRYMVGVDFYSYLKIFQNIEKNITEERLFVYIVRICKLYVDDLKIFLIFSMITMLFLYKTFVKCLSKYRMFGLYIYITSHFFPQNMGQIRLSLAIVMCLSSIVYLKLKMQTGEKVRALLIIILAILIQRTALIFLIVYFLVRIKKITKKILLILLILSFFIGKYFITKNIIYFFGIALHNQKLMSMLYTGNKNIMPTNFSIYQLYIIITTLFVLFYKSKDIKTNLLIKIYSFGSIFYFLFINLSIFSSRFSNILLSINCLLFPLIISECKCRHLKYGLYCIVLLVGGYIYFADLYKVINILCPYRSWLFEN